MAGLPLFYKSIVPLNRETHRKLGLSAAPPSFDFAKGSHIVPALVEEFATAARHLATVFVPGATGPSPVFLVGLRPGKNEFVGADGEWTGTYLPAYLRRYPFIFGDVEGKDPIVCFDETYEGFLPDKPEKLFEDDGAETAMLRGKITFANDYFQAARRSETMCKQIDALNLLRPISLEASLPGGATSSIHGFLTVDESRLAGLADADYLQLRSSGLLGPIYAHLLSLGALDRLGQQMAADAAGPVATKSSAPGEFNRQAKPRVRNLSPQNGT